jgi:hypothetical protein
MYSQADLNAAAVGALSRRLAAAFPAASNAVVHLEVGDYGRMAPPGELLHNMLLMSFICYMD